MKTIVANIISLVAEFFILASATKPTKKELLIYQSISYGLLAITDFMLGGYSGVVVTIICIIRNVLVIMEKDKPVTNITLAVLTVTIGLVYNNNSFIGLLPIIATLMEFAGVIMKSNSLNQTKLYIGTSYLLWAIFSFCIHNYVTAFSDLIASGSCVYNTVRKK